MIVIKYNSDDVHGRKIFNRVRKKYRDNMFSVIRETALNETKSGLKKIHIHYNVLCNYLY